MFVLIKLTPTQYKCWWEFGGMWDCLKAT